MIMVITNMPTNFRRCHKPWMEIDKELLAIRFPVAVAYQSVKANMSL